MSSSRIERKLAAIMFTDIVGFTKIMGDDETTALSILEYQQSLINPIVKERKGTIIKKMGDGLLVEFPSTVEAVECATQMQESIKTYNLSNDNIEFHIRIGIHLGDIVILGDDILGDGVNIASRIEPLAHPDGICITEAVYQSVKSKLKLDAKRIDEVDLKHIDDKYTIYKLPKQSDEIVDSKDDNEIDNLFHNNRVIIESVTDITSNNAKAYFTVFIIMLLSYYIGMGIFLRIVYLLEGKILEGISDYLVFLVIIPLVLAVPLAAIFSRKKYKINCVDIRNIPFLLDILILEMGYKVVKQSGRRIEYIHKPKIDFLINFLKDAKYYPKFLRILDTFVVTFDGNTIEIVGFQFHVKKVIRKIKKRNVQ